MEYENLCETLLLIKNATIYAPQFLGVKDVLITGEKIGLISENIDLSASLKIKTINGAGKILTPGFIDNHVHILGGGGEGGFKTRTPEIVLTDTTRAGVTTVVGCLGTDGVTRTMTNLIAKARGLEEEGISAFVYTGSYEIPVRTVTGSIVEDIVLIDKIIGVGEIAISDHRSSHPTFEQLAKLASDARLGGMLSGKAGIINVHIGDSDRKLGLIENVIENTEIPPNQFLVTHVNRSRPLFLSAVDFAQRGGLMDLTTGREKRNQDEIPGSCAQFLKEALEKDTPIQNISFSSDGQGSLPIFDNNGNCTGLEVSGVDSILHELKLAITEVGLSPEIVLQTITSNPARNLKLKNKGIIAAGKDADLVLLNADWEIDTVIARGKLMIENHKILTYGTFEEQR
ncbi:beta-aspartyl-peptidase [candidate division KSB1 bacterium 4484_87]|nr:MAG: beta-aspartyl-peptidase [candidate division KSB1 bacterium 4484_87]